MSTISNLPQGLHELGSEGSVPCEYLCGSAGTGKTFELRRRIAEDENYGILCATTGVAAMNLGAITLNSILGYFDTESLQESFFNGWLNKKIKDLAEAGYANIIIDEISMLDAKQLDIIYQAAKMVNEIRMMAGEQPIGIVLTGDFAQLSPIKAKWAFEAECWPQFDAHTTRLTKVWRQSDARFLEAINQVRSGNGSIGAAILQSLGVEFVRAADINFAGTTIMAKNDAVDKFNWLAHSRLTGVPISVNSLRWGEQRKEWKNIPESLQLKVGAYVMILSNDTPDFSYVNGDCGYVRDFEHGEFAVELVRNGSIVNIGTIDRRVESKNPPDIVLSLHAGKSEGEIRREYNVFATEKDNEIYWDPDKRKWVSGAVRYYPLRLAYATTVHRSQGLSLDRVQMDVNGHFMGAANMCYVALSRARSAEGLKIVGSPQLLASRVKAAPEILRWL